MNVLILNGSPRLDGNTSVAVNEIVKVLNEEGIDTEVIAIGNKAIRGCISCGSCAKTGKCVFDELNKYFTISNMPVVSSQYWNSVHGAAKGQANKDLEGLQTMRTLARNMAFLIKSIALGKEKYGLPDKEEHAWTNFIMD